MSHWWNCLVTGTCRKSQTHDSYDSKKIPWCTISRWSTCLGKKTKHLMPCLRTLMIVHPMTLTLLSKHLLLKHWRKPMTCHSKLWRGNVCSRHNAKTMPTPQALVQHKLEGFSQQNQSLPNNLQPHWDIRDELSCVGSAIVFGSRALIPKSPHTEVLDGLHAGHPDVAVVMSRYQKTPWVSNLGWVIAHSGSRASALINSNKGSDPLARG